MIHPMAVALRRIIVYCIFGCSLRQLVGLYGITIAIWANKYPNCVLSHREMSGESGNFLPVCSRTWGGAGTTLTTNVRALANRVLKPRTTSSDCCAFRVIAAKSYYSSSSVPAATGHCLVSSGMFFSIWIRDSNLVWSNSGGGKVCVFRVLISTCNAIICTGWSPTLSTVFGGLVYSSTLLDASHVSTSILWVSATFSLNMFQFVILPMMSWSVTDTKATRSCWSDPDIPMTMAHLPVPVECVNLGRGRYWGDYNI